jgi:hypothetical protein
MLCCLCKPPCNASNVSPVQGINLIGDPSVRLLADREFYCRMSLSGDIPPTVIRLSKGTTLKPFFAALHCSWGQGEPRPGPRRMIGCFIGSSELLLLTVSLIIRKVTAAIFRSPTPTHTTVDWETSFTLWRGWIASSSPFGPGEYLQPIHFRYAHMISIIAPSSMADQQYYAPAKSREEWYL